MHAQAQLGRLSYIPEEQEFTYIYELVLVGSGPRRLFAVTSAHLHAHGCGAMASCRVVVSHIQSDTKRTTHDWCPHNDSFKCCLKSSCSVSTAASNMSESSHADCSLHGNSGFRFRFRLTRRPRHVNLPTPPFQCCMSCERMSMTRMNHDVT